MLKQVKVGEVQFEAQRTTVGITMKKLQKGR